MQFYLCEVKDGVQLAGTQADAKTLDRGFTPVDVPTDKAGLMAYVNRLFERINGKVDPVVETMKAGEIIVSAGDDGWNADHLKPAVEVFIDGEPPVAPLDQSVKHTHHKGNCPMCDRSPKAAKTLAEIDTRTQIEDMLGKLDAEGRARIAAYIADIDKPVQPVAAPAPRERKRP